MKPLVATSFTAALLLGASWATADDQRAAAPAGSYGFVLTDLTPKLYKGKEKEDCPDGRALTVLEAFLKVQTPAERARLLKPENAVELERRYKGEFIYGPNGTDTC